VKSVLHKQKRDDHKARMAAIYVGLDEYFSKIPCYAGHVGWRKTANKACSTCIENNVRTVDVNPRPVPLAR